MNTLVDPQDGALRVPETRDETASAPRAPGDAAVALASSDATLIELAPESGRTLILPDGPATEVKRALADLRPGSAGPQAPARRAQPSLDGAARDGAARSLLARAQALIGAPDQPRLKRLAPFAVGVASLLATGIPLWFRSPRPPAADPAIMNTVRIAPPLASPPTAEPADDRLDEREAAPAPGQPPVAAGATAIASRGSAQSAGLRLPGDRRGRMRAGVTSRWKGRAWVLRTRNGSPVVD